MFVIVVIVLVLFLLKDSDDTPLKKAEKFYHSGDYTSYSELKLSETEIKKFNIFLEKHIDDIYQKYFDEEMSYEDAIRQIEATEQYSDSLSNLSSVKSNINELNYSRNAFNEAQTKEESEKYVDAYKDYRKVIEDDPNYDVAQEKIVDLTTKVIVEYKQLAADAANENNYTSAISYIDAALKIDSTNDELINLKNEYTNARVVKVAQEVEAARLKKLINVGDSFNTTNYSITLEDARITREVHPNNSGRAHLYYSCSDNNSIWLDLVFRIKNISVDSR